MKPKSKLMFFIGLIVICIGCSGLKMNNENKIQKYMPPSYYGQVEIGE